MLLCIQCLCSPAAGLEEEVTGHGEIDAPRNTCTSIPAAG